MYFDYFAFTEVRQDSLHFGLLMNPTHYESISVTWADVLVSQCLYMPVIIN